MYKLKIASSVESYEVEIYTSGLDLAGYDFVIADAFFEGNLKLEKILYISATEDNKNLSTIERICEAMRKHGVRRNSHVAAIGGGVVQDLATLACSLYMRGIKWDYFPSTLTGMMDSCLGGKSSINVASTKNLIGNIYPPNKVKISTQLAESLPVEDMISGFAEAVKICFARGEESFSKFLSLVSVLPPLLADNLTQLIDHSLGAKQWFIERDEFDTNERQLLNFGHTFGHALEAASKYQITHGVAVAIGMLAATSHDNAFESTDTRKLTQFITELLRPIASDLVLHLENVDWRIFESALRSDKKNTKGALCHILPGPNGSLLKTLIPYEDLAINKAEAALRAAIEKVREINVARN